MVDFNKESTVSTPATNVLKILILERWTYVIDAVEQYRKDEGEGRRSGVSTIASRLEALYWFIKSSYEENKGSPKELDNIRSNNPEKVMKAFDDINIWLCAKKLTKFDTRKQYDTTNVEIENNEKGL